MLGNCGLGEGDTITCTFDKITNTPTIKYKADIDKLLTFSASLGANYSGYWIGQAKLVLKIIDVSNADPFSKSRVGLLQITVNSSLGNLKSADETSDSSNSNITVLGSWGNHPAPIMT